MRGIAVVCSAAFKKTPRGEHGRGVSWLCDTVLKNMKAAKPDGLAALPCGHREAEDPAAAGAPWSLPYSSVASPNVGVRSPMFVPTWELPSRAIGPVVPASGTAWTVT
jgi:hypothetical protein